MDFELVGFSEIDKYAITAYCAIHNVDESMNLGDVSKIDINEMPECDLVTYGFPCSPKGQLVITEDGYKPIEDIQENDMVLTHNNKYEKVLKTMSRISKDMFKLKGLGFPELLLTGEHPLYIIRKGMNGDNPFWCDTKDIIIGDYLSVNINNKNTNIHNLTKQECWLLGRYLADGYIKSAPDCEYIIFCIGKHKSKIFEENSTDFKMTNIRKESDSCYEYTCFDRRLLDIIKHIGTGSNSKTVPEFIIDLPNDLLDVFLRGYLSGDGSYQEKTKKETYCTSSKKVSLGIQRIYLKLYEKSPAIYKRVDNRKESFSDTYNGQIRHHVIPKDTFIKDGKFYSKVKQISYNESFDDYVYNFEVETDNSYTLENIIVHNCQDISVAGNQKGIIEGETRSGLLYEALRIIKDKKPKYAIAENVKNLVGKKFKDDFESLLYELDGYGYNNYWQVLNAKEYGIPQNRERVFIISIRKDVDDGKFEFQKPFDSGLRLKDMLEDVVDEKYYINNDRVAGLLSELKEKDLLDKMTLGNINPSKSGMNGNVYSSENVAPTITTNKGEGNKIICAERGRYNDSGEIEQQLEVQKSGNSNALTTVQKDNLLLERTNELQFVGGIGDKDWAGDNKQFSRNYPQGNRVYNSEGIACSQTANGGGLGGATGLYLEGNSPNEIHMIEVEQLVRVRKHEVDIERLIACLRECKVQSKLTNRQISEQLNQPITLVEHWFRRDSSFAIPDADIWYKLKELLVIKTDEFDKSITEFEEREGVYKKGNRYYHEKGISPTLTTSANERIIEQHNNELKLFTNLEGGKWDKMQDVNRRVYEEDGISPTISTCQGGHREPKVAVREATKLGYTIATVGDSINLEQPNSKTRRGRVGKEVANTLTTSCNQATLEHNYKIRKLTPLECWRLMGFADENYYNAKKALEDTYYKGGDRSNSQMYKMAGNSIVVDVLLAFYGSLFKDYILNNNIYL